MTPHAAFIRRAGVSMSDLLDQARPFLDDEADGPTLLPHYREHVQDALDRVKGI